MAVGSSAAMLGRDGPLAHYVLGDVSGYGSNDSLLLKDISVVGCHGGLVLLCGWACCLRVCMHEGGQCLVCLREAHFEGPCRVGFLVDAFSR